MIWIIKAMVSVLNPAGMLRHVLKTAATVLVALVVAIAVAWGALWGLIPDSSTPIEAIVNIRQSLEVVVDAGELRADFEELTGEIKRIAGEGGNLERIETLLEEIRDSVR